MALLPPFPNFVVGQEFGPTPVTYEPAAYGTTTKSTFHAVTGLPYHPQFHTAIDLAAAEGTPIVASEAGKVVYSGWDNSGGGEKIQVEIRPGVSYCSNHCERLLVGVGTKVKRGQTIATVGATGAAHGFHDHFWVGIDEVIAGRWEHPLWNPRLFLPGGSMADDPRIKPPTYTKYAVIAAGQHIYTAPVLDAAHVVARDETKQVELKYLGTITGDDYAYGSGKTSQVWARLDAGNAAHTVRYVPYYRIKSFVER